MIVKKEVFTATDLDSCVEQLNCFLQNKRIGTHNFLSLNTEYACGWNIFLFYKVEREGEV